MRILVMTHEYYPKGSGIANIAYGVVRQLQKKHEVKVISPAEVYSYKKIEKLGGLGIYFFWKKAFKYLEEHAEEYAVAWLHNPLFTKKLNNKIVCLVHTTYNEYSKVFKSIYPNSVLNLYYKFMAALERKCYKKIGKSCTFTSTSHKTIQELRNLGVKGKISYISNGVDTTIFKPAKNKKIARKKLGLPEGKIMLFVGRIEPQKRHFQLLKTFKEMDLKDTHLVFVGDGPLLGKCKEFVKENKIPRVKFTGRIPYDDVMKYYGASDFFIMASIYEGQPIALMEALGSALVPILSDIPVFKDVLKDLKAGINLSFDDEKKAAKIISDFVKKTNLKKESGKVRQYSKKKIEWKEISKQYLKEFK